MDLVIYQRALRRVRGNHAALDASMITACPVKFELYDGTELLATIDMMDEAASTITIKTCVNHDSWPELAAVIGQALELMHKQETAT